MVQPDDKSVTGDATSRARALSQLFEQHNRTLVSFLANRLGNEAEAKEVAQEAYSGRPSVGRSSVTASAAAAPVRR